MEGQMIADILGNLFALGLVSLVAVSIKFLADKIGVQRLRKIESLIFQKKELADSAVKFAQQALEGLDGEEKFNEASRWLSSRLKELGLNVSQEEVEGYIESALKEAKLEFEDKWNEEVSSK